MPVRHPSSGADSSNQGSSVAPHLKVHEAPQFMAKPVLFCDFDGPIVDVSERYYQTYRKGLLAIAQIHHKTGGQALELDPLSKTQFWNMKQNRVADLEIAMRSGLPEALFAPFMQQVTRMVNHPSLLRWDSLQPSAENALRHLQQCNVRLVLVTLRHPRQVQDFLQAKGLEHLVDDVFGVADVTAAYVNRVQQKCELLSEAIAQQKSQGHFTQDSWMVGDTEADVLAGQAMGLSTAALSCGVRSSEYLKKLSPSKAYHCLLPAAREFAASVVLQAA
ncbi:MAG: HAD family hydrolase [Cyanobacteria bacterium J06597_16]